MGTVRYAAANEGFWMLHSPNRDFVLKYGTYWTAVFLTRACFFYLEPRFSPISSNCVDKSQVNQNLTYSQRHSERRKAKISGAFSHKASSIIA